VLMLADTRRGAGSVCAVQLAAGRIIAGHLGDQAPKGDDCDTPPAREG